MKLQTQLQLKKEQHPITYKDSLLLVGSCFASNMAEQLAYYQFKHVVNPFGVLFHPVAIEKLMYRAINEEVFTEADIFYENEQWHCFEVHSECSDANKEVFLQRLNAQLQQLAYAMQNSSYVVLTLGTAWVYRYIETDTIVANCHKVPQRKFLKELLSVEAIEASLEAITVLLKSVNPHVRIITTVSPVRHLKDGFTENMRSKAHLITAVQNLTEPRKQQYYFPSYELMMDELRDYRFYKEDMVHPNALAVAYIWEKFVAVWFAPGTASIMEEVATIQKGLGHKPFNPNSEAHQQFTAKLDQKIAKLQQLYPFMDFKI